MGETSNRDWHIPLNKYEKEKYQGNVSDKTLYFIDPTRNFLCLEPAIIKADGIFGDSSPIFIPGKLPAANIINGLDALSLSISERVAPYKTVNTSFDTELYQEAMNASKALFNILQSCIRSGVGKGSTEVSLHLATPFSIAFHDRFVHCLRQILELKEAVYNLNVRRILYFPAPTAMGRAVSFSLQALIPDCEILTTLDHLPEKLRKAYAAQATDKPAPLRKVIYDLPLPSIEEEPRENAIIFGTNLRDKQYRKTALPVILGLVQNTVVSVIDSAASDISILFDEFDAREPYDTGTLKIFEKIRPTESTQVKPSEVRLMNVLSRRFGFHLDKETGLLNGFSAILVTYLRLYGLPVIKHFKRLEEVLTPHVRLASRIVVTPGRTAESGVLAQLARVHGIPSVEIQSGTISKNSRFTKPQADYVLAIESFSKSVYSDFMKFPQERVIVVGGPKLEHDIGPMRSACRKDLRKKTASISQLKKEQKVLLFASQPVGISKSAEIFETILEGVSRADIPLLILIKPHPNEDQPYIDLYLKLAQIWKQPVQIEKSITALEAVILSDIVTTYYSTVGLEAFALHRPVISVNPFLAPSPYDLCELGVAHEAKDPIVMEFLLKTWVSNQWPKDKADPSITFLKDGLTMERTMHLLLKERLTVL